MDCYNCSVEHGEVNDEINRDISLEYGTKSEWVTPHRIFT